MWWRLFVPTWRFFDAIFYPELYVKADNGWRQAWPRPKSRWYSLVFNPAMTEWLARRNLLERMVLELKDAGGMDEAVSFSLVRHLVQDREFKIVLGGEEIVHFTPGGP